MMDWVSLGIFSLICALGCYHFFDWTKRHAATNRYVKTIAIIDGVIIVLACAGMVVSSR